ncbi:50S ribosomal protein L29 [Candidatus Kaiserbacteria bacterium RIFCSPLOWO2_01_FULL_52_12b]|uniref:Large ribosomal subunit protein uL29 n=1 Tax=Candidatus Kaiserbacteria bacterium RIFCSPLOWO2_01_FULL_52_12b TaxID=1798509 RepID=A0A1F6EX32_9BACT|nr:MAG: 50S ribosomal protein L29 [Candidatus Kaiserbacteria bacterium RIFCSPLOWO2_01_FULL_52_12b]
MTKKVRMTTRTDEELGKLLVDTRAELRTHRFAAAGARAKDPSSSKKLRATIARVLTEQSARARKTA